MSSAGGRTRPTPVPGGRIGDVRRHVEVLSSDSNRPVPGGEFHEGGAPR